MNDANCPYCEKDIEICHEDGYGYEEGEVYEQECCECCKIFGYTTMVTYSYKEFKLPCSNGEPHDLVDIVGSPKEFFVGKKRCKNCKTIIVVDKEANRLSMEKYMESIARP